VSSLFIGYWTVDTHLIRKSAFNTVFMVSNSRPQPVEEDQARREAEERKRELLHRLLHREKALQNRQEMERRWRGTLVWLEVEGGHRESGAQGTQGAVERSRPRHVVVARTEVKKVSARRDTITAVKHRIVIH
jgi:hypothetical protein